MNREYIADDNVCVPFGGASEQYVAELKAEMTLRSAAPEMLAALHKIADLSQTACMTFEAQSFAATEIAVEAIKKAEGAK